MHTIEFVQELLEDLPDNRMLTAKDVGEILGIHVATVIRYIDNGWLESSGQLPGGRGRHQISKRQVLDFYTKMMQGGFENAG